MVCKGFICFNWNTLYCSSESSSDSDSDEEDETKKTEPGIIPDNFVPENLMESTTDGEGPEDLQVKKEDPAALETDGEETKLLEASISSDQSKADSEELPTAGIDSPKTGNDSASKPAVTKAHKDSTDMISPRQLAGKDSDGELITMADNSDAETVVHQGLNPLIPPPAGKIKKRKSFNCTVLQVREFQWTIRQTWRILMICLYFSWPHMLSCCYVDFYCLLDEIQIQMNDFVRV